MGRSINILEGENVVFIKKNRYEKIAITLFSIFATLFFYYFLVKNIFPATKRENGQTYAIVLLAGITIILIMAIFIALRNFILDKSCKIEKEDEKLFVDGKERFNVNKVKTDAIEYVNRWGTKTYNVILKEDNQSFKIVSGINSKEKDYLIKFLSDFLKNKVIEL